MLLQARLQLLDGLRAPLLKQTGSIFELPSRRLLLSLWQDAGRPAHDGPEGVDFGQWGMCL